MPAELTRTSTLPNVSRHSATTRRGAPGSTRSTTIWCIRAPRFSTSSRVSPPSSSTVGTNTSAPAAASATVNACPSPVFPPVTTAVRPASEKLASEKLSRSDSRSISHGA